MKVTIASVAQRTLRYLGLATLLGAGVWACGGGGENTSPTALQTNSTTPWELLTAGDIAQCEKLRSSLSNAEKTASLIERQLATAGANSNVLTLGDNYYLNLGLNFGYSECYAETWGRFINKTFVIPGNHDFENNGEATYFDNFGAKASPGPSFGPDRAGYYRIDQSGWTVFALSSVTDATAASAQGQWLKKELATAKPCIAAAWHHPLFSSSEKGGDTKMAELYAMLDTAKADLVLQSHAHHYERFAPMTSAGEQVAGSGIPSFVIGTGGASLEGFPGQRAGSQKQIQDFGVMRLTLDAGKAAWRFIDTNDQVRDAGNIICRSKS
jgi:acid phosphatase type 7